MFVDIDVEELLELRARQEVKLVDVRSPSEYREGTIPGSLNIPLFNDEERAEVGTLYTRVSVQAAKDRGLELVSAKLPAFVKSFEQIKSQRAVFCWRGGMRSRTTATVLSLMGMRVYRLTGGVRAYRRWVVETLERMKITEPVYVIAGNTGSGKTLILRQLQEEGYPVLELEGMAGHRGSTFGHVGLQPHNQKTFDALLVDRMVQMNKPPYLMMEAESSRIGKILLPSALTGAKERGTQLFIELPLEERVRIIMEDYCPRDHHDELLKGFEQIRQKIHTPVAKEIAGYLHARQYEEAVALLLTDYYDPRYEHAMDKYDEGRVRIRAGSVPEAVQAVKAYVAGTRP